MDCGVHRRLCVGSVAVPAFAKDDLLETLAQKGVITMAEYEKLKGQRKASEVTMNTDDGFKLSNSDNSAPIQFGALQQFDLADYDEDNAKLSNGTPDCCAFIRSRPAHIASRSTPACGSTS